MSQSTLALVLAATGLGIGLVSLAWQFVQHFLAGPRVRIALKPGVLTHVNALITRDSGSARSSDKVPDRAMLNQGLWENVAVVQVENRGRIPISVSHVSLRFESTRIRRRGLWRWAKRTNFVVPGLAAHGSVSEDTPQRLDVGEMRQWIFPMCSIEEWIEHEAREHGSLRLRAVAHSGTRASVSSPSQLWIFEPEWRGRFRYAPLDEGTKLFRVLLESVIDGTPSSAYEAYILSLIHI